MNPTTFQEILQAIQIGLAVFAQIWQLFNAGVPVTTAPQITAHLITTPGLTDSHKATITSAVQAAAAIHG